MNISIALHCVVVHVLPSRSNYTLTLSFLSFESQYVRELLPDGTTGNILLQHRPGLVGFKNRFQKELSCEEYQDVEPVVEVYPDPPKPKDAPMPPKQEPKIVTDPKFDRTPEHRAERCNIIYQGYRNLLPNCPLHVYFVAGSNAQGECEEDFKFHLGLEDTTKDYMNVWDDRTKFEATYMGHTFVARLASDPSVLVDSFTLQPTEIHDCPNLKQKPIVTQKIIEPKGVQASMGTQFNITNIEDIMNATNVVVGVSSAASE